MGELKNIGGHLEDRIPMRIFMNIGDRTSMRILTDFWEGTEQKITDSFITKN